MNVSCPLRVLLALLLFVSGSRLAAEDAPDLTTRSGRDLVLLLQQNETAPRAFHELSKRASSRTDPDFAAFSENHYDLEVVPCPQGPGRDPLYLVLYGFLSKTSRSTRANEYPIAEPDQLFPSSLAPDGKRPHRPAIDAFTADGQRIQPFGGDNVLDGTLADINGDGLIERIEITSYGVEKVNTVDVLQVRTVKPKAETPLAVLLNWGGREWTFRLSDADGDGVSDIELGPRVGDGLKPKATYTWNRKSRAYTGPRGNEGDHFRRLARGDIWKQLQRLHRTGLVFPKDPDFTGAEAGSVLLPRGPAPAAEPPAARPYAPQPLTMLSDADLLQLMGPGRTAFDFERDSILRNRVPPDFWTMDPKQAALAAAEANRAAGHHASFQLAPDDRRPDRPPDVCTIALTDNSSRCYQAVDQYFFLRADPQASYLAYARTASGGAVFFNLVNDQPRFDLRFCPLAYEDARFLAATLWWLDRLRSRSLDGDDSRMSTTISTADGFARFVFRDERGATLLEREATRWSGEISERWTNGYDHEAFVNFATYLIGDAFPGKLGSAWTEAPSPSNTAHLTELTQRYLAWSDPGQTRVSHAIAACAADAAGTLVLSEAKPLLENIVAALPAETTPPRSYKEVSDEYWNVFGSAAHDPAARELRENKLRKLDAERDAISRYFSTDGPNHLRETAARALRKIETAQDPAALHTWAMADDEGNRWALQRLARLDPVRYVQALEGWIQQHEARWTRMLFDEIVRVDPTAAASVATRLPPDKKEAVATALFGLQAAATASDEPRSLAELLAVLKNPRRGWEARGQAIDLLVPPDEPLRHPGAEVDEALLRVLEPDMADDVVNFTRAKACHALALRRRVETFDRIAGLLQSDTDLYIYDRLLGALVLLAQADPERLAPRIEAVVAPELVTTNKRMSEIFWAIWAADLRDLRPKLEELATSGPDDYEDQKASVSGGEVSPVRGRFHLARKIADLWRADDALTRIRLLAAFALSHPYEFASDANPERVARLDSVLQQSVRSLTNDERERLPASLQSALQIPPDGEGSAEARKKVLTKIQASVAAALTEPR